jgi:hypothetical protein
MEFVPLTSDQQRAFADDGFLVVPNALDRETIDRVLNEADTLAGPFLSKPVIADKPESVVLARLALRHRFADRPTPWSKHSFALDDRHL